MIRIKLQEIYDIAADMDLLIHHVFCQGAGLSDKNSVARGSRKNCAIHSYGLTRACLLFPLSCFRLLHRVKQNDRATKVSLVLPYATYPCAQRH